MLREMLVATMMMAQVAPGAGSTSASLPVSPSAMATFICRVDPGGGGALELLILWRGRPGWISGDGQSRGGSGSGGGGSIGGRGGPVTRTEWLTQGGVSLHVQFEPQAGRLWIQDREVPLNGGNAVMVDDVDSPGGPRVVSTLRIDPSFEAVSERGQQSRMMPPRVQEFIRRAPELVEFLRCDVQPAGLQPYEQKVFEMMCAAVKQP